MLSYMPKEHKTCNSCGETKPFSLYRKAKSSADGLRNACSPCLSPKDAAWREKNPTHYQVWTEFNPDYEKDRYQRNRDSNRARARARYAEKAEFLKRQRREYYLNNQDAQRKASADWRAKNPSQVRAQRAIYYARKADALVHDHVSVDWLLDRDGRNCYYCGMTMELAGNSPSRVHLEHKTPLSRGGKHSEENCVLACRTCNLRKHDKTAEEFLATF